jgi:hypothetical protein
MIDPGTAAIAVLSTVTGVAGYGAMKINANQARVMDETANRLAEEKIEAVRRKLKAATEELQAKAQRELDAKTAEIKDLKKALDEIEDAKKTLTSKLQQATEGERLFASVLLPTFKKAINSFKKKVQPTIDTLSDSKKKAVEKVFDKYISTTRLNISRGSMQSFYQDLTKAAGQSFMDRAEFDRVLTETLKEVSSESAAEPATEPAAEPELPNKTPGDSFLDTADNVVLEADLREKELKETEDILAERLEEAKADKSTDGKVRIGRLKKAIKSAEQAKDRIVTARNRFKDTRDSYKKEVANARKTLRARRVDPEDKAAAETTLRLPPSDVQESVSETLDKASVLNADIKSFLDGKDTTVPSSEQSVDTETADTGARQRRVARRKQEELTKSQTPGRRSSRKRRIPSFETPSSRAQRMPPPESTSPPPPISIPEPTPVSTTDPTPVSTADSTSVSTADSTPVYKELPPLPPIPKVQKKKFNQEPSSRVLFNPSSPRVKVRSKAGMRKKKLRTRRGTKQTNVRRTRRS